jgi:hypothetical protein
MIRIAPLLLAAGLAAAFVGCQPQSSSTSSPLGDTSNLTLVKLKVPNMT